MRFAADHSPNNSGIAVMRMTLPWLLFFIKEDDDTNSWEFRLEQ